MGTDFQLRFSIQINPHKDFKKNPPIWSEDTKISFIKGPNLFS